MTGLSLAKPGLLYTIKWNLCTDESGVITREYGLCPGETVFLMGSCFGNVIVRVNEKKIVLSRGIAERIKV